MRLGSEVPRIYTPPLRKLTPKTTHGFDVIKFARDILEVELFPWQKWLLIHMLELREDGSLRFATAVVLVARQNGKSTLSQVLALWFMMRWGWPLILGTAQDLDLAEEVWEGAVELLEEDDELKDTIKKVFRVNGKKSLNLANGTRYKVKAANRKAGRGLSGNLILLDELREQQNWEAWGAITKTTMAQTLSLVLALSNAGDVTSVVLRYLRQMAHKALGDPDGICKEDILQGPSVVDVEEFADEEDDIDVHEFEQDEDTLFLAEWSAPPGCDVRDRDGWAMANPSMNHPNGIPERNIASACRTDPEWVFRTEVLCQWSDGTLEGPFPPGAWEKGHNETVEDADGTVRLAEGNGIVGKVRACVDMSADRSMTYIAFAGWRDDGAPQVELVAQRRGHEWIGEWLMERRDRISELTGQTNSAPISDAMQTLDQDREFTIPVVKWASGDLMAAHGITFDAVRDGVVRHNPQPVLDVAAATAVLKKLGDGFVINRQASPADAAPLVAFEGALWLLLRHTLEPPPPPPPPQVDVDEHATDYGIDDYSDDLATMSF